MISEKHFVAYSALHCTSSWSCYDITILSLLCNSNCFNKWIMSPMRNSGNLLAEPKVYEMMELASSNDSSTSKESHIWCFFILYGPIGQDKLISQKWYCLQRKRISTRKLCELVLKLTSCAFSSLPSVSTRRVWDATGFSHKENASQTFFLHSALLRSLLSYGSPLCPSVPKI